MTANMLGGRHNMAHRTWVPQALWLAFSNIPSPEPPTREVLRSRGIVSHWAQPLKSPFHRAQPTAQEMNGAILSFFSSVFNIFKFSNIIELLWQSEKRFKLFYVKKIKHKMKFVNTCAPSTNYSKSQIYSWGCYFFLQAQNKDTPTEFIKCFNHTSF